MQMSYFSFPNNKAFAFIPDTNNEKATLVIMKRRDASITLSSMPRRSSTSCIRDSANTVQGPTMWNTKRLSAKSNSRSLLLFKPSSRRRYRTFLRYGSKRRIAFSMISIEENEKCAFKQLHNLRVNYYTNYKHNCCANDNCYGIFQWKNKIYRILSRQFLWDASSIKQIKHRFHKYTYPLLLDAIIKMIRGIIICSSANVTKIRMIGIHHGMRRRD